MNKILWLTRGLIGLVFFFNVQSAILFLVIPQNYAPGFELGGPTGNAIMRGIGLLFLMWNVPYAIALYHPVRCSISLVEACIMQAIGLLGESIIAVTLPNGYELLQASVTRFIYFDAVGMLALVIALILVKRRIILPLPA